MRWALSRKQITERFFILGFSIFLLINDVTNIWGKRVNSEDRCLSELHRWPVIPSWSFPTTRLGNDLWGGGTWMEWWVYTIECPLNQVAVRWGWDLTKRPGGVERVVLMQRRILVRTQTGRSPMAAWTRRMSSATWIDRTLMATWTSVVKWYRWRALVVGLLVVVVGSCVDRRLSYFVVDGAVFKRIPGILGVLQSVARDCDCLYDARRCSLSSVSWMIGGVIPLQLFVVQFYNYSIIHSRRQKQLQ